MVKKSSIVINGDLGSGKTTISVELARRLGLRRVSVGDLYRQMASERGMTTLQLNLHAELDDAVDGYVDRLQSDIANSGQQLVVDSRLAWFFFTSAFKVHLITDPLVAAERVLGRPASDVESYATVEEAVGRLRSRSESERIRFLARYGADKAKLRNYSLVCDTTRARPGELIERIARCYEEFLDDKISADAMPMLLLDPARVYPSEDIRCLRDAWTADVVEEVSSAGPDSLAPISVGYTGTHFYVVDGHRRLSAALRCGFRLISARLLAERDEPVVGGMSAANFFASEVGLSDVHDWAEAHGITLPVPPHAVPATA